MKNLKKWNGITPWGKKLPYNCGDLMIDDSGTVYYKSDNEYLIWCPASRLENHVHHLCQIVARR